MLKRRYVIEASLKTLAYFTAQASLGLDPSAHISRLSLSAGEEYYYVVLVADQATHNALFSARFTNSKAVQ